MQCKWIKAINIYPFRFLILSVNVTPSVCQKNSQGSNQIVKYKIQNSTYKIQRKKINKECITYGLILYDHSNIAWCGDQNNSPFFAFKRHCILGFEAFPTAFDIICFHSYILHFLEKIECIFISHRLFIGYREFLIIESQNNYNDI